MEVTVAAVYPEKLLRKSSFSISLPTACVSVLEMICTASGVPTCMLTNYVTKFNKPKSPHHLPVYRSFTKQQSLLLLSTAAGD